MVVLHLDTGDDVFLPRILQLAVPFDIRSSGVLTWLGIVKLTATDSSSRMAASSCFCSRYAALQSIFYIGRRISFKVNKRQTKVSVVQK